MKNIYKLSGMSNLQSSDLTGFEKSRSDRVEHLERDRWPEFERELRRRRPRITRFDVHHYGAERQPWEWLVWPCRTWTEVERVLNRHRVDWERENGEIVMEGMRIYRCR
jgi:hypothetical protein